MILSDSDIIDRVQDLQISIRPEPDWNVQLQPASLDLRLGNEFQIYGRSKPPLIDPMRPDTFLGLTETVSRLNEQPFIVRPDDFVLATTREIIELPNDILARLEGRSSLGRLGIIVHSTAGFIDPGFSGRITLEISNLGHIPVALYPGMRVCQLVFEQLLSYTSIGYGRKRGSKYQGQQTVRGSELYRDKEFNRVPTQ